MSMDIQPRLSSASFGPPAVSAVSAVPVLVRRDFRGVPDVVKGKGDHRLARVRLIRRYLRHYGAQTQRRRRLQHWVAVKIEAPIRYLLVKEGPYAARDVPSRLLPERSRSVTQSDWPTPARATQSKPSSNSSTAVTLITSVGVLRSSSSSTHPTMTPVQSSIVWVLPGLCPIQLILVTNVIIILAVSLLWRPRLCNRPPSRHLSRRQLCFQHPPASSDRADVISVQRRRLRGRPVRHEGKGGSRNEQGRQHKSPCPTAVPPGKVGRL